MSQYSSWFELRAESVEQGAPRGAAALQVRRAEGVVTYPDGKSAMVWFGYSSSDAMKTLQKVFADELETPGSRGQGHLLFRYHQGPSARASIIRRANHFAKKFGVPPLFNQ